MPTRDAAAYAILTLLLLFVAVNLQAGWVYAVDALLIGFALAGWVSTFAAVRRMQIGRVMPAEVFEGQRVAVRFRLPRVRPVRFLLELRDAVPGLDPGRIVLPVLAGETVATYHAVARRRGLHRVETVDLTSAGLTGMFRLRRALAAPGAVIVFPSYAMLPAFPLPGRDGLDVAPFPQPSRTGIDVAGVRDFRDGDDPTRIHWRSTARRGHLVVREFERDVEPAATLLIDTRRDSVPDAEAFEDLVRAAASVAHYVTSHGRAVRLLFSRGPDREVAAGGWMETLRVLAGIELAGGVAPPDLLTHPAPPSLVLFTGDADAAAAVASMRIPLVVVLAEDGRGGGRLLLEALGVPTRVLQRGQEVGACLAS